MFLRRSTLLFFALMLAIMPAARAQLRNHDVYVGYSRLGANTFYPNVNGLNGWNGALHIHVKPFLGVEGDVAHYGLGASDSTPKTTTVMVGPRVTLKAVGIALFAHGLVGGQHSSNSGGLHVNGGTATYALGGGIDVPVFPFFAWRIGGDRISPISDAPSGASKYRINTGLVFRF